MEPMKTAACLGVIPPGTDFVRGVGVGRRLNMGYGISNEGGPPALQTRFAVELRRVFLNRKKGGNER